jgi:hypothetical protein
LARSDGIVLARYPKMHGQGPGLTAEEPVLSGIKKRDDGVITGRSSADNLDRIAAVSLTSASPAALLRASHATFGGREPS